MSAMDCADICLPLPDFFKGGGGIAGLGQRGFGRFAGRQNFMREFVQLAAVPSRAGFFRCFGLARFRRGFLIFRQIAAVKFNDGILE
jgi:hypothetical protein